MDQNQSPQVGRGMKTTDNAWNAMEEEFGLLTESDVAALVGDRPQIGKSLRVRRHDAYLYSGFQFDHTTGQVLPVVLRLIDEARNLGVGTESLAQWFCMGSATLDGARPVDLLQDE